jgi:transcriptional regulator with GAF, ATPase, and Fis domain
MRDNSPESDARNSTSRAPAAVRAGKFRLDLFYRLDVFPICVPPLRDRPEDILVFAKYFIDRYAAKAAKRVRQVEKRTVELLEAYDWPGNIRELQNVIERAIILCDSDTVSVEESWLRPESDRHGGLRPVLSNHQREIIEAALTHTHDLVAARMAPPRGLASRGRPWRPRLRAFALIRIATDALEIQRRNERASWVWNVNCHRDAVQGCAP